MGLVAMRLVAVRRIALALRATTMGGPATGRAIAAAGAA